MKETGDGIRGFAGRMEKEWKKIVWPGIFDVRGMTAAAVVTTAAVGVAAAAVDAGMMALINTLIERF